MEIFKMNYYFNLYKDKAITSAKIFKNVLEVKHHINRNLAGKIYVMINKYQTEKYGESVVLNSRIANELKVKNLC